MDKSWDKKYQRILRMECHKDKNTIYICQPQQRKGYSLFPKWYCYKCGRYILPDKFHKPVWIALDKKGEFARSYKSGEDIQQLTDSQF